MFYRLSRHLRPYCRRALVRLVGEVTATTFLGTNEISVGSYIGFGMGIQGMDGCAGYVKPVFFSLFAACALGCSTYGSAQSSAAETPRAEPPQRNLWSRGETRFLKQWPMLGLITGELTQSSLHQAGGEGAVAPLPKQAQASSASERRWVELTSFGNEINVAAALNARGWSWKSWRSPTKRPRPRFAPQDLRVSPSRTPLTAPRNFAEYFWRRTTAPIASGPS